MLKIVKNDNEQAIIDFINKRINEDNLCDEKFLNSLEFIINNGIKMTLEQMYLIYNFTNDVLKQLHECGYYIQNPNINSILAGDLLYEVWKKIESLEKINQFKIVK